jgi:hypothetical protein
LHLPEALATISLRSARPAAAFQHQPIEVRQAAPYKTHAHGMASRSRQFLKEQERKASWERLRTAPWDPRGPFRAIGSGVERIQLIHSPSFDVARFWEVCELRPSGEFVLYSSTVQEHSWRNLRVQGYEPVPFESDRLRAFLERLKTVQMPIAPALNGLGGLDGETTQLALFGDLHSQVRFQWWSDPPPGWEPLVEIANEMRSAFRAAATSQ